MSDPPSKQSILDEIRRIAVKGEGKPPGQGTFEDETGISASTWKGRYWARWNDAVAEAGFVPNSRTQRIEDSFIYEKLVAACRHYKRLPTHPEMLMFRRHNDESFPFFAIKERSSKTALWSEFQTWLSSQPSDYQDVRDYLKNNGGGNTGKSSDESPISGGFVYLMQSGDFYKIGKSEDVERRVKEIRTQMPESLVLIHTIKTDDTAGIERYWHQRFEAQRANGEWFKLSKADVLAFKKRKFQ